MNSVPLTSFLNLSVLASHPGLTAEVLMRASAEIPALRPAALAANVISELESPFGNKCSALHSLLQSIPFRDPLNAHPSERYPEVFRSLALPGSFASLPLDEALSQFAQSVWETDSPWLRPVLAGVVQAGGLGPLALAIERHFLGTSEEDYRAASAELRRLEEGAKVFLENWKRVRDIEVPGSEAFRSRAQTLTPRQVRRIKFVAGLGTYFGKNFPPSEFPAEGYPSQWTDYLLRRPGRNPGDGSCSPRHGIYAHLSIKSGVDVQPVFYPQHVNAYDAELDLVIEASTLPYFTTLEEWRACRFLGAGEGAAPSFAFLWSVIVNLGGDSELSNLETASKIHEGSAHHLAYRGLANYQRAAGKHHARQAIERNPDHPLPHALLARYSSAEGDFEAAAALFERSRDLLAKHPRPKSPTGLTADLGLADVLSLGRHAVVFTLQAQRLAEAARILSAILDLAPADYESMAHLGTVAYWIWLQAPEGGKEASLLDRAESLLQTTISRAPQGAAFLIEARRNLETVKRAKQG